MIEGLLVKLQSFHDLVVTFKQFDRIPALLFFRQIVDTSLFDMCQGMFDIAGKGVHRNGLAVLGSFHRCSGRLIDVGSL